jgi:hypothetical protein
VALGNGVARVSFGAFQQVLPVRYLPQMCGVNATPRSALMVDYKAWNQPVAGGGEGMAMRGD